MEAVEMLADLCTAPEFDTAADALAEVQPGGHFFAAAHTLSRYDTAFREPLVADLSNHGHWSENGSLSAEERAAAVWQRRLTETPRPAQAEAAADRLAPWIEARTKAGGAPPLE